MSKKKNMGAKVYAILALVAILGSVFGTGIIVIYDMMRNQDQADVMTPEQLQEILQLYTGATLGEDDEDVFGEENDDEGELEGGDDISE